MVQGQSYFSWPLRRIEVEKAPGSEERRTLVVPAVRDRVLQTAVAAYLEPFLEAEFDEKPSLTTAASPTAAAGPYAWPSSGFTGSTTKAMSACSMPTSTNSSPPL